MVQQKILRSCKNQGCEKPFSTYNPSQLYCRKECRTQALKDYKKRLKAVKHAEERRDFEKAYNTILFKVPRDKKKKLKKECITTWDNIREKILKISDKYYTVQYSGTVFIYLFCKTKAIPVDKLKIEQMYHVTEKEFRKAIRIIMPLYQEFSRRDKKAYVAQQIKDVCFFIHLNSQVCEMSSYIIEKLWNSLRNFTEKTITALVLLFSIIHLNISLEKFTESCKYMNIRMGSIHNTLESRIFPRLRLGSFNGFNNSAHHIKAFLEKYIGKDTEAIKYAQPLSA